MSLVSRFGRGHRQYPAFNYSDNESVSVMYGHVAGNLIPLLE